MINSKLLSIISLISLTINAANGYKVIYAVNCGGDEHTDSNGIKFEKDSLKVGTSSDFGRRISIGRVSA
jgi:Malectin domain